MPRSGWLFRNTFRMGLALIVIQSNLAKPFRKDAATVNCCFDKCPVCPMLNFKAASGINKACDKIVNIRSFGFCKTLDYP
jgi:hypothetical protein